MHVLFIKTSSLGDVVHHLPAVTEARRQRPDALFAWVVEEAYAPLAALHPAVDEVVPIATRRWRRQMLLPSAWGEARQFYRALRARPYDEIIDTQGLLRSGIISKLARGHRNGYDHASIRERTAAQFYDTHFPVARDQHAVERNRLLTGAALGYRPEGAPDYGLSREVFMDKVVAPYAVLLHGTARREKEWPESEWLALTRVLERRGPDLLMPWGNQTERERGERLAEQLTRGRVPLRRPLDQMVHVLAGARFVVGVDTGLMHLAAALGVPLVAIFAGTMPRQHGPLGTGKIEIIGASGAPPSLGDVSLALERILS